MGRKFDPAVAKRRETMRTLREQGIPVRVIAAQFGVTIQTVYESTKSAALPDASAPVLKEPAAPVDRSELIRRAARAGMPAEEICRKFRISRGFLKYVIDENTDDYQARRLGRIAARNRAAAATGRPLPSPLTTDREYSPDEMEFLRAIDAYRATHHTAFVTNCEYLLILKSLGYQKCPAPQPQPT